MEINWQEVINKDSFPFEIKDFQVVQTHISYVFITDKWVYKIKKPVNFGFLDFTTLEKRKFFCEKEVELNRRLCPDVYLGVVPVVKEGEVFKFEGKGRPLEYAVKMKRMPVEKGLMQKLLKEKKVTPSHIDLIVKKIVPFYKNARTGKGVNEYGSIETISFNTEENFEQTKDFVGRALAKYRYKHIVNYTRNFIKEKESLFLQRIEKGFIREGHGDLYSANICFEELKEVYIFDCIEFNERFRCGDVASDLAFLAMDLDFFEEKELSRYFIDQYVQKSQDFDLIKLLDFYKCYRAYVRGKIGCFTYASKEVPEEERKKALSSAIKYFNLAYLYAGGIPRLIVFMGLSGSGKTFLAKRLMEFLPAFYLASDVVRKELAGLDVKTHVYEKYQKGLYSPEMTEKTYLEMIKRAKKALSEGYDVILDATFKDEKYRALLKKEFGKEKVKMLWIWCEADDEIIRERIEKRKKEDTYSDALWEIYLAQKKDSSKPAEGDPVIFLDTSKDERELVKIIKNKIETL